MFYMNAFKDQQKQYNEKKNETFANFIFAISKTGKAMYIISDWTSSSGSKILKKAIGKKETKLA